jgi:hypothetical protein
VYLEAAEEEAAEGAASVLAIIVVRHDVCSTRGGSVSAMAAGWSAEAGVLGG